MRLRWTEGFDATGGDPRRHCWPSQSVERGRSTGSRRSRSCCRSGPSSSASWRARSSARTSSARASSRASSPGASAPSSGSCSRSSRISRTTSRSRSRPVRSATCSAWASSTPRHRLSGARHRRRPRVGGDPRGRRHSWPGVPAFLVIAFSAISGAAGVVNGALILLGRIKLEDVAQPPDRRPPDRRDPRGRRSGSPSPPSRSGTSSAGSPRPRSRSAKRRIASSRRPAASTQRSERSWSHGRSSPPSTRGRRAAAASCSTGPGRSGATHQLEHAQITPRPGWVEHDADEILERVRTCVGEALRAIGADAGSLAAVGISNQRETTVVWDRRTGRPVGNAIVWQDTRTAEACERAGGGRGGRHGPVPGTDRAADLDLLVGPQARLDPRRGRHGTASCRGPRRPALRDHRHLADLAPDRRARRRRPRDRRHERLAHDADGPRDARLGPGAARDHRRPGRDAPRDPRLVRGLRHGRRRPRGRADRGRPRRPARGAVRAGLLRGRPDQVHVRDRLLHAHAHGRAAGPLDPRPHHDRRGQDRRRPGHLRARRLGRGRGLADQLASRQPRHHRRRRGRRAAGPLGARQRRRRLRARVLGPVRARTGGATRGASSPG